MTTTNFTKEEKDEVLKLKQDFKEAIIYQNIFDTMDYMSQKFIIAGGVFTSIFHKEDINDVDIFLLNGMDVNIVRSGSQAAFQSISSPEYASNTKVLDVLVYKKWQIIKTSYPTRKALVEDFDFSHSCASYSPYDDTLMLSPKAFRAMKNKILVKNPTTTRPLLSKRIEKFVKRGFTMEYDVYEIKESAQ